MLQVSQSLMRYLFLPQKKKDCDGDVTIEGEGSAPMNEVRSGRMDDIVELREENEDEEEEEWAEGSVQYTQDFKGHSWQVHWNYYLCVPAG